MISVHRSRESVLCRHSGIKKGKRFNIHWPCAFNPANGKYMKYLLPVLLIIPLAACAPRHEPAPVSCAGSIPLVSENFVAPAPIPAAPVVKKPVYRKKRTSYRRTAPRKTTSVAAKKTVRRTHTRRQAQVVTPPIPLPVTPVEPVMANEATTHVYTPRLQ